MSDLTQSRFYTRARANNGRKVYLADPATGKLTEYWVVVRSRWCDEFQEARNVAVQQAFDDAQESDPARRHSADELRRLSLVAALVGDWHLDVDLPCTRENVIEYLRGAPQIVEQIDRLSAKDQFFFREPSSDS